MELFSRVPNHRVFAQRSKKKRVYWRNAITQTPKVKIFCRSGTETQRGEWTKTNRVASGGIEWHIELFMLPEDSVEEIKMMCCANRTKKRWANVLAVDGTMLN